MLSVVSAQCLGFATKQLLA